MASASYHSVFYAMGSRLDLLIPGVAEDRGEGLGRAIQAEVDRLEGVLSRYREGSEVYRLNRNAANQPVIVSAELFVILRRCKEWKTQTSGYFDVSMGMLRDAWKDNPEMDPEFRMTMVRAMGMDKIILDASVNTVFFSTPDIQVDLGALGKGIALGHIRRILQRESILNALVSFGDSSVLAHGNHPYGETWAIGMQQLENPGQVQHVFYLKDQSLSTSGISAKNSLSPDRILGHIFDPLTGIPLSKMVTMSVVSSDPVEAEVLSTALLCAPEPKRELMLKNFKPAQFKEISYECESGVK